MAVDHGGTPGVWGGACRPCWRAIFSVLDERNDRGTRREREDQYRGMAQDGFDASITAGDRSDPRLAPRCIRPSYGSAIHTLLRKRGGAYPRLGRPQEPKTGFP